MEFCAICVFFSSIFPLFTRHLSFAIVADIPTYQVAYPFGGDIEYDSFAATMPAEPEQEYKPHPQKTYTSTITMKAPASFKPIPIQEQDNAPKPAPPAVPPKPFKDTSIFQNVDTHAVEVLLRTDVAFGAK